MSRLDNRSLHPSFFNTFANWITECSNAKVWQSMWYEILIEKSERTFSRVVKTTIQKLNPSKLWNVLLATRFYLKLANYLTRVHRRDDVRSRPVSRSSTQVLTILSTTFSDSWNTVEHSRSPLGRASLSGHFALRVPLRTVVRTRFHVIFQISAPGSRSRLGRGVPLAGTLLGASRTIPGDRTSPRTNDLFVSLRSRRGIAKLGGTSSRPGRTSGRSSNLGIVRSSAILRPFGPCPTRPGWLFSVRSSLRAIRYTISCSVHHERYVDSNTLGSRQKSIRTSSSNGIVLLVVHPRSTGPGAPLDPLCRRSTSPVRRCSKCILELLVAVPSRRRKLRLQVLLRVSRLNLPAGSGSRWLRGCQEHGRPFVVQSLSDSWAVRPSVGRSPWNSFDRGSLLVVLRPRSLVVLGEISFAISSVNRRLCLSNFLDLLVRLVCDIDRCRRAVSFGGSDDRGFAGAWFRIDRWSLGRSLDVRVPPRLHRSVSIRSRSRRGWRRGGCFLRWLGIVLESAAIRSLMVVGLDKLLPLASII